MNAASANSSAADSSVERRLHRLLRRVIEVRPAEVSALGWSWLYIFAVLSSYYIMRPIRDQMGVAGGVDNLQWLFLGTLTAMLLLNVPFWYLVKTLPRAQFIAITYRFFAANILLFAVALYWADAQQIVWVGRAFFVWISVFNLFIVSVFWQLMVDIFSSEDGKRLFGFIAAGATIGAIVGSGVTASLARHVPVALLLIGAALLLEVAVFGVRRLSRQSAKLHTRPAEQAAETPIGGNVLAGITHPFKSSYLMNVSAFLLLFAITSTFLYFQQAGIVSRSFHDRGAQTAFFATIDLAVNVLTLLVQLFLTGRIVRSFGVGPTLAFLPALTIVGFGALALLPGIASLMTFQVLRRSSDYAIARPTREVLYTVVPREDRYKAKSFIDTVVYRAGDQVGAWSFTLLSSRLGMGSREIGLAAVILSAIWLVNGLWLGRKQDMMAAEETRLAEAEA
ncbi:MAG TPA: MFS transporter [Xanthobacteraceae bacterium]|nr:MFS transporter [Xanthobacteraceae bacterium]